MNWLRDFVFRLLRVQPARERSIIIREPMTFRENVLRNKLWYRGDPAELEQFFRQTAATGAERARFWASVPQGRVRKMHSGLVGTVVDRYRDIVASDLQGVSIRCDDGGVAERWEALAAGCGFDGLVGDAVAGALSAGDGAFKITIDERGRRPVVSFCEADRVDFVRRGRTVTEVRFHTTLEDGGEAFRLEERYGPGYVRCRLFDEHGGQTELRRLAETSSLGDVTFDEGVTLAVPFVIFDSSRFPGRGKALFEDKTDAVDALDEVLSQWLDAVRMGRVKRYIPEDMLPRDMDTGELLASNPFDNDFIAVGSSRTEGVADKIEVSQPDISYEAYVSSYMAFLELALPATLGVDLKKTDNAEAQREKEKITLFVRGRIVDTLCGVLPRLVEAILQADDLMHGEAAGTYDVSVRFGEYASPGFDSTVETVVKATQGGVMSIEQAVEELYGDTWTEDEKAEEVRRLRERGA